MITIYTGVSSVFKRMIFPQIGEMLPSVLLISALVLVAGGVPAPFPAGVTSDVASDQGDLTGLLQYSDPGPAKVRLISPLLFVLTFNFTVETEKIFLLLLWARPVQPSNPRNSNQTFQLHIPKTQHQGRGRSEDAGIITVHDQINVMKLMYWCF